MFSLEDAYTNITLDDIFLKISEYELWKYYCPNFEKFEQPFKSVFYNDNNADCWIFKGNNNKLKYKDFGTGEHYTILEYIQRRYNCNFKECITIIANDFNLSRSKIIINNKTRLLNFEESVSRNKARIDILSQPFNFTDFTFWNKYKIPLDLLQKYNIYSCKSVYLIRDNRITTYNSTKNNPIYAYRFNDDEDYSYKIYFPCTSDIRYKWLFSGSSLNIEGYDQLSLTGDLLIITKSLKDVLCLRLMGYDSISLQSENNLLSESLYKELKKRFSIIISLYDNDFSGLKGAKYLYDIYKISSISIPKFTNCKDISDFIEIYNLQIVNKWLRKKIKKIV